MWWMFLPRFVTLKILRFFFKFGGIDTGGRITWYGTPIMDTRFHVNGLITGWWDFHILGDVQLQGVSFQSFLDFFWISNLRRKKTFPLHFSIIPESRMNRWILHMPRTKTSIKIPKALEVMVALPHSILSIRILSSVIRIPSGFWRTMIYWWSVDGSPFNFQTVPTRVRFPVICMQQHQGTQNCPIEQFGWWFGSVDYLLVIWT